jgi:hypothetical protein
LLVARIIRRIEVARIESAAAKGRAEFGAAMIRA